MSEIDLSKLAAPFPGKSISWRVGSTTKDKSKGMALAYIDARDVQDRLDAVCGPQNWMNRYPHANGKTVCEIGIRINGEWVWKADGAGDSDVEAEKGALSDAFKRAAVRWGVGRYLYDLDSPWVELEQRGSTHVIAKHELERLAKLVGGKAPAKPAVVPQADPGVPPLSDKQRTRAIEIYQALKAAKTQTEADRILKLNEKDIAEIASVHESHKDKLMTVAMKEKAA